MNRPSFTLFVVGNLLGRPAGWVLLLVAALLVWPYACPPAPMSQGGQAAVSQSDSVAAAMALLDE